MRVILRAQYKIAIAYWCNNSRILYKKKYIPMRFKQTTQNMIYFEYLIKISTRIIVCAHVSMTKRYYLTKRLIIFVNSIHLLIETLIKELLKLLTKMQHIKLHLSPGNYVYKATKMVGHICGLSACEYVYSWLNTRFKHLKTWKQVDIHPHRCVRLTKIFKLNLSQISKYQNPHVFVIKILYNYIAHPDRRTFASVCVFVLLKSTVDVKWVDLIWVPSYRP